MKHPAFGNTDLPFWSAACECALCGRVVARAWFINGAPRDEGPLCLKFYDEEMSK